MFHEPKILIVGAGAAGIAAAVRLIEKGLNDVTILEATNRIGGRIHTVEFSDNIVELGAQWVHGERGNVVFDLAFPHKLLDSSRNINDFTKYVFVTAKGEVVPQEESTNVIKTYHDISDRAMDDLVDAEGSYGEYFTNEFYKILKENPFTDRDRADQFLDWMQKYDNSIQCSDTWYDVSAKGLTNYWQCEGDPVLNWKYRGYKTLFDLLSRKFPNPKNALPVMEKIKFNKDVTKIDYTSNRDIIVRTGDGSKYSASHVIFTASLGVLKEKHATIFTPVLPEIKQRAIKGLSIGTANKIFLEFPHRWWQENIAGFSLIWSKEDKAEFLQSHGQENEWLCDVFEFFTVDYEPRLLCAWIVGKYARHMETLSETEVSEKLHFLLEMFLSKTYNVCKPDRIIRSTWYKDEHFRGSYSFRSIATEELNVESKDLADPIESNDGKPIILFAGEATHEHYYSTVHGAVETGFREADRIVDFQRTRGWLKQVINSFDKTGRTLNTTNRITGRTKLVIVGAGIAGLAAAKTLEDANFKDYLLFEAQKEVGGRIKSISWNKGSIEYGAQFLHGDQSELAELSYQNDLLSDVDCRDGQGMFLRDDGLKIDDDLIQEIDDLTRTALEECENYENRNIDAGYENIGRALRTWFRKHLRRKNDSPNVRNMKEEIFDWNIRWLMIDNSCLSLDELSTKHWGKFKFVGGQEHLSLKAGYSSLTNLIADSLHEQNLRLNVAVELVEWQQIIDENNLNAPIILHLSDGTRVLSDCVIITCSLGYLKENHRKMFSPPLPSNLSLGIESLGFGLINKVFLDFGTRWWSKGTKGFQMIWKKPGVKAFCNTMLATWTKDLTGFDVLSDQEGVLLGWIGGRGAYIVETLTEQQVATDCENLLRYYLKVDNIPTVKRCLRTQWNTNKYVRGSYSHISVKCDDNGVTPSTLAEPLWGKVMHKNCSKEVPIIMLAGEATHEQFYSTTHGAYETGVKQAQIFLRHHVTKH